MKIDLFSLKQLDIYYHYKLIVAERLLDQQFAVVAEKHAELEEIYMSLSSLQSRLSDNSTYMRDKSVSSDANKMVMAFNYKAQIEYDMDREQYFRMLAEEEMRAQQTELNKRKKEVQKTKIRIKEVSKKVSIIHQKQQIQEELLQEEEHQQAAHSGVLENG